MDDTKIRIAGLGGSLRSGSSSLAAVRAVLDAAEAEGAVVELLDVRALDLPPYGLQGVGVPPGAARLREAVTAADGMVWSSPMYHGTVSGSFKNALDWLQLLADADPPFLTGKPVGLVATAGGVQGLQAVNTMEYVVRALRGWTVPFVVPVARAHLAFAADGTVRDQAVARQLSTLGREVAAGARLLAPVRSPS